MTTEKYFATGNDFYKKGDFKNAIANYDKAIEINPNDAYAYCDRGIAKFALGDYKSAIADFDKVIEINPKYAEAYYNRGNAKAAMCDYKSAIADYDKAIEINPNFAMAYYNRGHAKSDLGDKESAIADFDKAIEINPKDAGAYGNRGIAKFYLRDYKSAIADFDKAIEINPNDDAASYFNRGIAKFYLRDYKSAIADYDKAIKINPNDAEAYNNHGNAKSALGDKEAAIADYDEAIEINPKYAEAYNNRGTAKDDLGDKEAAIADFNEAIEIKKDYADAYLGRAKCYFKKGDYEKAKDDFKESKKSILEILNFLDNEDKSKIIEQKLLNDSLENDTHYKETVKDKDCPEYQKAYIQSIYIISMLHINDDNDDNELPVAHYTQKDVADALLVKDKDKDGKTSNFRLNSINYSNDPTEGEVLCKYLFDKELEKDPNPARAFAACFTFNADCLNQFRLYGKADNRECSGVSITFNKDFFADKPKLATSSLLTPEGIKSKDDDPEDKSALFRCMYIDIDPKSNRLISVGHKEDFLFYREGKAKEDVEAYNKKINDLIQEVSEELEELKGQCKDKDLDKNILSQLFLNLRYLTKHVAFKEEQECRIVKIKNVKDSEVIMTENRRQIHLEYVDCRQYVKEIVFGKNASGMNIFQDRLLHEGLDKKIPCRKSDNPFA